MAAAFLSPRPPEDVRRHVAALLPQAEVRCGERGDRAREKETGTERIRERERRGS